MKKHWLFTILMAVALCVVCLVLFPAEAEAASVDDLSFTLNTDGENYAVTGCNSSASGTLEIPSTYNGKPVTFIGDDAFRSCASLTSVTIPDSVTSIGQYAFGNCDGLTSITIPDGVTSIGKDAFYDCDGLTRVTIGNSVTSIGDHAFRSCASLTRVTIGNSVTSIGDYAFYGCSSLTSITIPDSVTSIGDWAFHECTRLTSVTIPDGVTSIGSGAFAGCSSLTNVTIPDGVTSIGDWAFHECTRLTSVTIGNRVTSIGDCAFRYCASLTRVTIGNSVTSIGKEAFTGCDGLTSITIPDGVTSIGRQAFYDCNGLTRVTIGNSVTSIGEGAFFSCNGLTDVYIFNPSAWCNIAFEDYSSNPMYYAENLHILDDNGNEVTSIILDGTVTAIPDKAFYKCTNLTSVTIGNSITSIGRQAFYDCNGLTRVTIGNSVTSIGEGAFYNCSNLTSITISNGVTNIGKYAFDGCISLKDVYYSGSESKWNQISIGSSNTSLTRATKHYYHVHDYSLIPAVVVPATCTEAGYTEYTCAYGEKYISDFIPATGHIKGNDSLVIAPTCESNGYTKFICQHCLLEIQADFVNSLGHDFNGKRTVVPPKCFDEGYTIVQCTRCTATTTTDYVDCVGHAMIYEAEVPATCTKEGHTAGTLCSRCGFLGTATKLRVKGHSYNTATCNVCGFKQFPVAIRVTATSVTLAPYAGYEYSKDGVTWQSSNVFTGLKINTTYTFYQRIAESETNDASEKSEAATITTLPKADCLNKAEKPILVNASNNSISLLKIDGYEYKIGNGAWQDSPTFNYLEWQKSYTVYQRIKETATHKASASSAGLVVNLDMKPSVSFCQSMLSDYIDIYGTTQSNGNKQVKVLVSSTYIYLENTSRGIYCSCTSGSSYGSSIKYYFGFYLTPTSKYIDPTMRAEGYYNSKLVTSTTLTASVNRTTYTNASNIQIEGYQNGSNFQVLFNEHMRLLCTAMHIFLTDDIGCGIGGVGFSSFSGSNDGAFYCDAATNHKLGSRILKYAYAATCDRQGYTGDYCCSYCGEVIEKGKTISALGGHKYSSSCDEDCNKCGLKRDVVHQYSNTCDTTCNVCNATRAESAHVFDNEYDEICNICSMLVHAYDDEHSVVTKATLTKDGKIVKTCRVCNHVETVTVKAPQTFTLSTVNYTYNGAAKKPAVTVKDSSGKTLVNGTDYTVTYPSGRTALGTYTVTITMKGYYSGTKTLTFNIKLGTPNVTVANAANGVKVSWNTIAGAKNYTVYRSVYTNGAWSGWKAIKTGVTGTSYTDTSLKSNDNVKYTVRAFNGSFSSTYKSSSSIKYLAAPTVTVSNAANGVKISWNKIAGTKTYTVYKSVNTNGKWSAWKAIKTGVTGTTYTDTSVKSNDNVKYTVRAFNGNFSSTYKSSSPIKFLATPTVKVANAAKGVSVTWNKITGAKSYDVYRSVYSNGKWSGWTKIKTGVTGTSYTDTTVKSGATVKYTVRAVNSSYVSSYAGGNAIRFLTQPTVKVAKATNGIKASWGKVTGATGYIVYRRTYSNGKWSGWTQIKTTTALSYTDTTAKKGVTYQYTVRAYSGSYKSSYTNSTSIKR